MTTSEVIGGAWSILRSEGYSQPGVYERRIFATSRLSLFAALERPADMPQIHFHLALRHEEIPEIELRGVVLKRDFLPNGLVRVRLELIRSSFEEIFSTLVGDVVSKALVAKSDNQAFEVLIIRLRHWQRFMQAAGPQGLSPERQAGLFGELTVLRALVIAKGSPANILVSWQGPNAKNQDFFHVGNAIEVKATTGNVLDSVRISNEHQLDNKGLLSLSLCHLCFDVRDGSGISLPTLIDDIRSMLPDEEDLTFTELLLSAGYIDGQRHLYASPGYIERRRIYYRVTDGFPRILANDLMQGVCEVAYRLNLSGCSNFKLSEPLVLKDFLGSAQ
jgi:hypothetical protein